MIPIWKLDPSLKGHVNEARKINKIFARKYSAPCYPGVPRRVLGLRLHPEMFPLHPAQETAHKPAKKCARCVRKSSINKMSIPISGQLSSSRLIFQKSIPKSYEASPRPITYETLQRAT